MHGAGTGRLSRRSVAGGRPIERQAGAAPRASSATPRLGTASGKGSGRESNIVWVGTLASLTASLGTAVLGALGIFLVRRLSDRTAAVLLSVAAGIMLAALFFSPILPGIAHARQQVASASCAVAIVIAGRARSHFLGRTS